MHFLFAPFSTDLHVHFFHFFFFYTMYKNLRTSCFKVYQIQNAQSNLSKVQFTKRNVSGTACSCVRTKSSVLYIFLWCSLMQ